MKSGSGLEGIADDAIINPNAIKKLSLRDANSAEVLSLSREFRGARRTVLSSLLGRLKHYSRQNDICS